MSEIVVGGRHMSARKSAARVLAALGDLGGGKLVHTETGIEMADDDVCEAGTYEYRPAVRSAAAREPVDEAVRLQQEAWAEDEFDSRAAELAHVCGASDSSTTEVTLQTRNGLQWTFSVANSLLTVDTIARQAGILIGTENVAHVRLVGNIRSGQPVLVAPVDPALIVFPEGIRRGIPIEPPPASLPCN
jgi:hypothetical protein